MGKGDKRLVINSATEIIFSQAAALHQSGRFKSSVHILPKEIFLVNSDSTMILRFPSEIQNAFSFRTDDYDSSTVSVSDSGEVTFLMETGDWCREKTPGGIDPAVGIGIKAAWDSINQRKSKNSFSFHQRNLALIDDRLSHLEIGVSEGRLFLLQRDIYTGSISKIWENGEGLLAATRADFPPVALRTSDFLTLFSFRLSVQLHLHDRWAYAIGQGFEAIMGACHFEEMGEE